MTNGISSERLMYFYPIIAVSVNYSVGKHKSAFSDLDPSSHDYIVRLYSLLRFQESFSMPRFLSPFLAIKDFASNFNSLSFMAFG